MQNDVSCSPLPYCRLRVTTELFANPCCADMTMQTPLCLVTPQHSAMVCADVDLPAHPHDPSWPASRLAAEPTAVASHPC